MNRFDYPLDDARIAATPLKKRNASRLFIYDRKTKTIAHQHFPSLMEILRPNDLLILNDTRVFPARLRVGTGELLLIRPDPTQPQASLCWEVLVRGRHPTGSTLVLPEGGSARIVADLGLGRKKIVLEIPRQEPLHAYLDRCGEVPLPPYILRRRVALGPTATDDKKVYQTVYAKQIGSVAAPTAGLHWTRPMISAIQRKGVAVATITLHIGTDTFRPIQVDTLSQHKMSGEWFAIPEKTAYAFAKTRAVGGRVFAVGTSVTRALESAFRDEGGIEPICGETDLFITPGYTFRAVDALVTNLHPPRSTGMVLVAAFAGCDTVLRLYHEAIEQQYRFLSYGDAMLIL